MSKAALYIQGDIWQGWESVHINRGMEQASSSYISSHPEQAILIDKILSENLDITGPNLRKKIAEMRMPKVIEPPCLRTCNRIILKRRLKEH